MKKVFLDDLPHGGKWIGLNKVNWEKSIGYEVPFVFNDVVGKLKIVNSYKKNNIYYLDIKYKDNFKTIRRNDFSNCRFATLLGIYNTVYKYQIGDVVTDINSGKLKILEQIKIKYKHGKSRGYKYKCLICGNIDDISHAHS